MNIGSIVNVVSVIDMWAVHHLSVLRGEEQRESDFNVWLSLKMYKICIA